MQLNRKFLPYEFQKFSFVSLGAIPGSFIRWQLNNDLIVNLIGALILGFVIGYDVKPSLKLLIGVGFCGALTTFSSWIVDCFQLLIDGYFLGAVSLIIVPVIIGLFVSAIGHWIGIKFKLLRLYYM
tara:strand:- start:90 stop:467 length:378 start_codon:yes stop_codon:yes gene_type:complete